MSPTIFQYRNFRFFFFSREETRIHVHVYTPDGEAKYWLEPKVELAVNHGLKSSDLATAEDQINRHENEIKAAWKSTSAEVTHISPHGIWLLIEEQEYFLGFTDYPWFEDAKVADIHQLELIHGRHLRWESLDVDIELSSLGNPSGYPLIYR